MLRSEIASFSRFGQTLMSFSNGLIDLLIDLLHEMLISLRVILLLNKDFIIILSPNLQLLADTSIFSSEFISPKSTAMSLAALSPKRLWLQWNSQSFNCFLRIYFLMNSSSCLKKSFLEVRILAK